MEWCECRIFYQIVPVAWFPPWYRGNLVNSPLLHPCVGTNAMKRNSNSKAEWFADLCNISKPHAFGACVPHYRRTCQLFRASNCDSDLRWDAQDDHPLSCRRTRISNERIGRTELKDPTNAWILPDSRVEQNRVSECFDTESNMKLRIEPGIRVSIIQYK